MSGEVRVGYTVREADLRLLQEPAWAGRLEAGEIARTNDQGGLSFASVGVWREFTEAMIAARTPRRKAR